MGVTAFLPSSARTTWVAHAFIIGEAFVDGDECALILGDNIFFGHQFTDILTDSVNRHSGATVFA